MIRLNNKEYSGYVSKTANDTLSVIVHTVETFHDVVPIMNDVKEVIEIKNGEETSYAVTSPVSAKIVTENIYLLVFSTKPTYQQQLEAKIMEQSNAIDDLLIAFLEG